MKTTDKELTVVDLLRTMKEGSTKSRVTIFKQFAKNKFVFRLIDIKIGELLLKEIPPEIILATGNIIEDHNTDPRVVMAALNFLSTLPEKLVPDDVVSQIRSCFRSQDPAIAVAGGLAFAHVRSQAFISHIFNNHFAEFGKYVNEMK